MTTKKLVKFFEDNDFNVHLFKQDKKQCAEIEKWTNGGVDMCICLQPFNIESFNTYVRYFSIDDEIDLHRQEKLYRDNFTISQSLNDFTEFHDHLKEIKIKLNQL